LETGEANELELALEAHLEAAATSAPGTRASIRRQLHVANDYSQHCLLVGDPANADEAEALLKRIVVVVFPARSARGSRTPRLDR
jgi:hypothetical protein